MESDHQNDHDTSGQEIEFLDAKTVPQDTSSAAGELRKPPVVNLESDQITDAIVIIDDGIPLAPESNKTDEVSDSESVAEAEEITVILDDNGVYLSKADQQFLPFVYAAQGGAYGSIFLGIFAIIGALISTASAITGITGIILGMWGLNSRAFWYAITGIGISALGTVLSVMLSQLGWTLI